jgi:hypothetical protein
VHGEDVAAAVAFDDRREGAGEQQRAVEVGLELPAYSALLGPARRWMRPVSGGAADGLYGGVVEVEHVGLSAQAYPFLVGCLQADDRCGCDRAGLQGAAVGVGQPGLDQRCEQILPAGLLLAKLHHENRYDRATDDVERITGKPPVTVEEFVAARKDFYLG